MTDVPDTTRNTKLGHLLLRADASSTIGTGHVMRCLALAEAWLQRGGRATMVSACESPLLRERVRNASVTFVELPVGIRKAHDPELTIARAKQCAAAAVVIDGYDFDAAYQRAMKKAGCPLVVFDDNLHTDYYCADLVINPNLHAGTLVYKRDAHTRLLLGPQYVILRSEFTRWKNWIHTSADRARRILVTLGGSDADNVTLRVLQALDVLASPYLEAQVVVGPSNPHLAALEAAQAVSRMDLTIEHDVRDMAARMAWADLAVAAGGTTCWELAFMGLPSIMIILADNQRRSAEAFAARGATWLVGNSGSVTVDELASALSQLISDARMRDHMAFVGRQLIDGGGAKRVVNAILELGEKPCNP